MDPIDETVLADFLAGRLSPARRAEVIRHLAVSESSRELLRMAYLAREAVGAAPEVAPVPERMRRRQARPAMARARWYSLRNVSQLAAVVTLLLGVGAVLRFAIAPPADQVRNGTETAQTLVLDARISPRSLAIRWEAVPGADHYEVMVWDEEAAQEVLTERVSATVLPADGAFATALRRRAVTGRRYALRVTAFDATNRRLVASDLTPFTYQGD